ncbi:hypothetical protein [Chryseobacterium turcicum]|uniref:Uncharacterized protein n=1 Tax=Chryseobacterium turcicum TaxID=2898076 RepID=A0A9Q3YWM5_9FLAO|nr:hypothetical protein [Chryseobacterium turcicum]MCD1118168.1 hypothetical protein [Chryseobacterium turcicum]
MSCNVYIKKNDLDLNPDNIIKEKILTFYNNKGITLFECNELEVTPSQLTNNFINQDIDKFIFDFNIFSDNRVAKKIIEEKFICAIKDINLFLNYVEKEKLIEDKLVFLTKNLNNFKKGDVFLVRKTNLTELYFHFYNENIYNYNLVKYNVNIEKYTNMKFAFEPLTLTALLSAAAIGFAEAIGSNAASSIYASIFPDTLPSFNEKTLKQLSNVIKKSIREEAINEIKNEAEHINYWFKTLYTDRKNTLFKKYDGKLNYNAKKDLYDMLYNQNIEIDNKIIPRLNFIKDKELKNAEMFSIFMLLATQQFFIMAEMIDLDPEATIDSPSSIETTLKSYIKHYSKRIEDVLWEITEIRKQYVIKSEGNEGCQREVKPPHAIWGCVWYYRFEDKINNYSQKFRNEERGKNETSEKPESAVITRNRKYNEYIENLNVINNNELDDPLSKIKAWKSTFKVD